MSTFFEQGYLDTLEKLGNVGLMIPIGSGGPVPTEEELELGRERTKALLPYAVGGGALAGGLGLGASFPAIDRFMTLPEFRTPVTRKGRLLAAGAGALMGGLTGAAGAYVSGYNRRREASSKRYSEDLERQRENENLRNEILRRQLEGM